MTGGIIPKGFDTIIPIEQIIFHPNKKNKKYILIEKKISKYNHVRFAGSDFKKKEIIVKKNTIIQPNHILAFKTLGIKNITVKKKLIFFFFLLEMKYPTMIIFLIGKLEILIVIILKI